MKMFRFTKIMFLTGLNALSYVNPLNTNHLSANSLSCISMNNKKCIERPEIINVNSDEPAFYLFSIKTSKCSSSGNNINDHYAKMCVPDVLKNLNTKAFNLISKN